MKPLVQNQRSCSTRSFPLFVLLLGLYALLFLVLSSPDVGWADPLLGGLIYQDFEGPEPVGHSDSCTVRLSLPGEPVHSGSHSWRIDCGEAWGTADVQYKGEAGHTDLRREKNDRLTFWIHASPEGQGTGQAGPVAVLFYDHAAYEADGFEVETTYVAHYGAWTKLTVLFDQLPDNLHITDTAKLGFKFPWPGAYYLDDIQAVREDRYYQSFEPDKRGLSITDTADFGRTWGALSNTCTLSQEKVFASDDELEGDYTDYSWKCAFHDNWAGTGIKSEHQYLYPRTISGTQSFEHVDLDPEVNDQLKFAIYALPQNGLDNSVNVQFFDHGVYHTAPVNYWPNQPAVYGQWTQITVPFSDLLKMAPDLNLNDIDKLQIQTYWPGTYYIDAIKAVSSIPSWDNSLLKNGVLKWTMNQPLERYRLQENTVTGVPRDLNWTDVYTGTSSTYTIPHILPVWYRVRAEDVTSTDNEVPFVSAWSDPLEYNPPAVLIDKSTLMNTLALSWTQITYATVYTVESAASFDGPWTTFYTGSYPTVPLPATENTWYRVRAGAGTEQSDWGPPQWKPDPIYQDFLRTYGTTIRKGPTDEIGEVVALRGVNLGNYLLIEPWLNGWENGVTDYYTIRKILTDRCGAAGREEILQTYRDSYLTEVDFDIMMRLGLNLIRLPFYYGELQDDEGNLLPDGFAKLDRVIEASADRGMYVLLDMHGAPGAQSKECHTGRCDYNKLFQGTEEEQTMFQARTVALWESIADRYQDNTAVMGYDLLNEPMGVIGEWGPFYFQTGLHVLWEFYDRLYDAIRAKDPNHIIVMEAIWDFNTLPPPSQYGWQNVVYQLHTYCPECDGDYDTWVKDHRRFVDGIVDTVQRYQDLHQYQVPVMVGEFNAYASRGTWAYYLGHFNDQGWSWTPWTYKMARPNHTWGLLTDHHFDEDDLPNFMTDTCPTLRIKLSEQFGTLTRYMPHQTLVGIIKEYATEPYAVSAGNRFQAEYYDAASGITTEPDYIGSLDTGDWVRYDALKFSEDLNTFKISLAVDDASAGKQILVRLDQITGTVVSTLTAAGTGGWWTFAEQRAPLSSITGVHDVYLTFAGGGGVANVDWFTFAASPVFELSKDTVPVPLQLGGQLTYTLHATNYHNVPLTATVIDMLPLAITPTGLLTWTVALTGPGGVWDETIDVTMGENFQGLPINRIEATTGGWPTGQTCSASCTGTFWVAVQTSHGRYISAMDDEWDWVLRAEVTKIQDWEEFTAICLDDGRVALKTHHGKYVSARPETEDWLLKGYATEIQDWEKFTLICVDDGKIALKTYHGRYVTAMNQAEDWVLKAEATELGDWEKFALKTPIVFLPLVTKLAR
jgi:aryl-phospho-beta-D-glucosidase BglC (GH1 family)